MDKYYVPLEEAKQLKKLGFIELCHRGAYTSKSIINSGESIDFNKDVYITSLPLYCQIFDWFDEVHGLRSWIVPVFLQEGIKNSFKINSVDYADVSFTTKEEANKACLDELIFILQCNKQESI